MSTAIPQLAKSERPLRLVNRILSLVVIGLAIYILISPYLPLLSLYFKNLTNRQQPYQTNFSNSDGQQNNQDNRQVPKDNTLVIPKIKLTATINEGKSLAALRNGVWHRPGTGSPEVGSNTVIAGHRFTYNGDSFFYNLDKLNVGDKFAIFWSGKEYDYEVFAVSTVPPEATEIEGPTREPTVTLYTCTPLWSAKNRLIIQAKPLGSI